VEEHSRNNRLPQSQTRRTTLGTAASRFLADESGKISIVSIPVVMLVGMLIAFVVNTGTTVREKIQLQNAADAGASTASLWMARSMNAVTTTNHLIGEATAVLAICDGFGGPMLYDGKEVVCKESKAVNDLIKNYRPAILKQGAMSALLAEVDERIVATVRTLVTRDEGKHAAGAALYDGKMTLKHLLATCFFGKQLANIVLSVAIAVEKTPVAPAGVALEGVALVAHEFLTLQVVAIGKEWLVLEGVEMIVMSAGKTIIPPIESGVIRGLCFHADMVVTGGMAGIGVGPPMCQAIQKSLDELAVSHGIESITLAPRAADLRLPLVKEAPPPSGQSSALTAKEQQRLGPWEQPKGRAWTGNYESGMARAIESAIDPMAESVGRVGSRLNAIIGPFTKAADKLFSSVDTPSWLNDAKAALAQIDSFSSLLATRPPRIPAEGSPNNPCYGPVVAEDLRIPRFHWRAEASSQWVRATHPYVNDRRGGIITFLRKQAPMSNVATYFVNWSDRYTLVRSHLFRREDQNHGSTSAAAVGPRHMYVISGMDGTNKGNELWATAPLLAGKMFGVLATAAAPSGPRLLDRALFRRPSGSRVALAGALVANGNGILASGGKSANSSPAVQADTGWDTLNWQTPVAAWEWGNHAPRTDGPSLQGAFNGESEAGRTARVRLAWEGLLVPIEGFGLRDALQGGSGGAKDVYSEFGDLLVH